MKYRENVCQYKNFSSISIVSGSDISHTSSRCQQKRRESAGATVEHWHGQLGQGLGESPTASAFAHVPSSCPWDLEWQSTGEGPHAFHTGGGNSAPQAAGRGLGVCTGHTHWHVGTRYADDGDGHGRAAWDLGHGGSGLCVWGEGGAAGGWGIQSVTCWRWVTGASATRCPGRVGIGLVWPPPRRAVVVKDEGRRTI